MRAGPFRSGGKVPASACCCPGCLRPARRERHQAAGLQLAGACAVTLQQRVTRQQQQLNSSPANSEKEAEHSSKRTRRRRSHGRRSHPGRCSME